MRGTTGRPTGRARRPAPNAGGVRSGCNRTMNRHLAGQDPCPGSLLEMGSSSRRWSRARTATRTGVRGGEIVSRRIGL